MKKILCVFFLYAFQSSAYEFASFNDGYSKEETAHLFEFLEENKLKYTLEILNGEKISSKEFSCADDPELCLIQKARQLFKDKKYEEAEAIYSEIPNRSFYWPCVLVERAWVNYFLKNYNRSLGLLSTFKFPLLNVFYGPEITYLTALSFYKLCYWGDAYWVIDDFKKSDLAKFDMLKKTLASGEKKSPILDNWFKTLKRTSYFSTNALEYVALENERAHLSLAKASVIQDILLQKVTTQVKDREKKLNVYFNKYLKNKLDNTEFYFEQIEILELEILSISRKSQYQKVEGQLPSREKGSYEYLPRSRFQFYWDFSDEFWADELGNYVFALKSQCEAQ